MKLHKSLLLNIQYFIQLLMFSSQDSEMLFHSEQLESSFIRVIIDFLLSIGFKPF